MERQGSWWTPPPPWGLNKYTGVPLLACHGFWCTPWGRLTYVTDTSLSVIYTAGVMEIWFTLSILVYAREIRVCRRHVRYSNRHCDVLKYKYVLCYKEPMWIDLTISNFCDRVIAKPCPSWPFPLIFSWFLGTLPPRSPDYFQVNSQHKWLLKLKKEYNMKHTSLIYCVSFLFQTSFQMGSWLVPWPCSWLDSTLVSKQSVLELAFWLCSCLSSWLDSCFVSLLAFSVGLLFRLSVDL